ITKFVNALSAASEVGGPAACASLLGYSDHYTDHVFKVFFWKGYVRRAMAGLPSGVPSEFENLIDDRDRADERVVLGTAGNDVVPLSKVNDYVFRPRECSRMCLYDFLRSTDVRQSAKPDSCAEDANGDGARPLCDERAGSRFHFQRGHPLVGTHCVHIREVSSAYTLNFCGGPLPRPDRGDREEYCFVMLVLFAPDGWRTGADLLNKATSWSDAFEQADFKLEHRLVMKNMNVLYECQDARDDYSA
ncbi:hypothetical protein OH77DRAFT_1370926, partial [Trametes cingulata]